MRQVFVSVMNALVDNLGSVVEVVCLAVLAAVGAGGCWLLLARASRFLKDQIAGLDILTRFALLLLGVFFAQMSASKHTNGVDGAGTPFPTPPVTAMSAPPPVPDAVGLTISDFGLTPSSAVFEVVWPTGALAADSLVWIHARTNLVAGTWEPAGYAALGSDAPPLGVEIPFAALPGATDGTPPSSAFFAAEAQVLADVDHDGVPDREETGWIEFGANLPAFDLSDGTTLFDASADDPYAWWNEPPAVPLPFAVWCGGVPSTNAVVLANGVVGFLSAGREDEWLCSSSWNDDLAAEDFVYSDVHAVVAACWDDLSTTADTTVRAATFGTAPERWFVVECADVTPYVSAWDDDPPRVTYQVAVGEADPTTVYVRYSALSNGFDFASATLGAQGADARPNLPVSYNVAGATTNGTVVAYHFGLGTDPLVRDSDGDGLEDGDEIAAGTSPRLADTDGDGLPDRWEVDHGFDPLSADGDDGAYGDPDGDGLLNIGEWLRGSNPGNPHSDGDGLDDGAEAGGVVTNGIPWLAFSSATELTDDFVARGENFVTWALPTSILIQRRVVTNVCLGANGLVVLPRADHVPGLPSAPRDLTQPVDPDSFIIAPYASDGVSFQAGEVPPSRVRAGLADSPAGTCLLLEYENVCQFFDGTATNMLSFQLAIPTNGTDRAFVRIRGLLGDEVDGRNACVGFQGFDARTSCLFCNGERGRLSDGLSLTFLFGLGSDPVRVDSDLDGIDDDSEAGLGTDPSDPDTDGDCFPDAWEVLHAECGFDPLVPDNGLLDTDGDGLSDGDESVAGTDPGSADTDGDGVSDAAELSLGSDPRDATDGGRANSRQVVWFHFGDIRHLIWEWGERWERYHVHIEPVAGTGDGNGRPPSYDWDNTEGGWVIRRACLKPGWSYSVRMSWTGCGGVAHNEHAFSWLFDVSGHDARIVVDDIEGVFGAYANRPSYENGEKSAMVYVLGDPRLVPDYDRDGAIGVDDAARAEAGEPLRFWINDDEDSRNVDGNWSDAPDVNIPGGAVGSGSSPDYANDHVDGRCDLLDFTPLWIDFSDVYPPGMPARVKAQMGFLLGGPFNFVWTSAAPQNAGAFQRNESTSGFGPDLSQPARSATVSRNGGDMPSSFRSLLDGEARGGVVLLEGNGSGPIQGHVSLMVTNGHDCTIGMLTSLPAVVSPVENMYWFHSLRENESVVVPGSLTNISANVKDLDVFFTHGFNVSGRDARGWGAEIFKRLWQSGSNARFHMVTWPGDYHWFGSWGNGIHYHEDVYLALTHGAAFRALVEEQQADAARRVVMAQSLGNMMVCEAIRQGLSVGKYFMFDAAVASEAFDAALQDADAATRAKYVPSDWNGYDPGTWAANWHTWFTNDVADARGKMGWPGYFAAVPDRCGELFNYYSTGDPVFMEQPTPPDLLAGVLHWPTLNWQWPLPSVNWNITAETYCWQKQETHKGIEPVAGSLSGGWGFHTWHENLPISGEPYLEMYSASQANALVADRSITNHPVFGISGTPLGNRAATSNEIWRALAEHVPAVSSPVGGNEIGSSTFNGNENLNDNKYRNGWGRGDDTVYQQRWLHSDMKDMAYFYVYKLYGQLIQKGSLR